MLRPTLAVLAALLAGCTSHTHATDFHGVPGIRGETVEVQRTVRFAVHGLFTFGLLGDAEPDSVVREFTAEAAGRGATRVQVFDVDVDRYWWVLPPISFLVQPVVTTVQGNVEGADPGR